MESIIRSDPYILVMQTEETHSAIARLVSRMGWHVPWNNPPGVVASLFPGLADNAHHVGEKKHIDVDKIDPKLRDDIEKSTSVDKELYAIGLDQHAEWVDSGLTKPFVQKCIDGSLALDAVMPKYGEKADPA